MTDKIDVTALRLDMIRSFERLNQALASFTEAFKAESTLPAWVQNCGTGNNARTAALTYYRALWYEDGQPSKSTVGGPGLVAATPGVIRMAEYLNQHKADFKGAVTALRKHLKPAEANRLVEEALNGRSTALKESLSAAGLGRVHLKQAYRAIPILHHRPDKVSFTWAQKGKAIRQITKDDARAMLTRARAAEDDPISYQINALETQVGDREILARVQPVTPHLRANTVLQVAPGIGQQKAIYERKMVHAYLPILFPHDLAKPSLPLFKEAPLQPEPSIRFARSGTALEKRPFLEAIHVYRYLDRRRAENQRTAVR